jgi:formimidoylglutamate deiminase
MSESVFWAPRAWLDGRWRDTVLLRSDGSGHWAEITAGVDPAPSHACVLPGPVLPGLVDAHSHAFQRAFAGMAERREHETDDFWAWRDRMYGMALRITPEQMRAVAAQLYVELLCGGYTQVCEFHYLHHAPDGQPYSDPAEMSWALSDAAQDSGIGLTVLPVLYERAGFAQPSLREEQRRFRGTAGSVHDLYRVLRDAGRPLVSAGVAIHSLRAAAPASIDALLAHLRDNDVPVHVHVAEQTAEVQDCLAATGARPIEWLCRGEHVDRRWQLVHATHATAAEIDAVAARGAGVVLCPSTEANLGDGLADLPGWLAAGVPLALGSDSHVSRCWGEELRWLEYGQRLLHQARNVAAAPSRGQPSTAARLLDAVLVGGGRAAGLSRWGLAVGARADMLVLDPATPGLWGVPSSHLLDALVFATDAPALSEVYVAGRRRVSGGRHVAEAEIADRFSEVMSALWADTAD